MYADDLFDAVDQAELGGAALITRGGKPAALIVPLTGDPVIEHATRMGSGTMQVRPNDIDRVVPLADWMEVCRSSSAVVFRRQIVVLDDWTEVSE